MCRNNTVDTYHGRSVFALSRKGATITWCTSQKLEMFRHLARHQLDPANCKHAHLHELLERTNCVWPKSPIWNNHIRPKIANKLHSILADWLNEGIIHYRQEWEGDDAVVWPRDVRRAILSPTWDADVSGLKILAQSLEEEPLLFDELGPMFGRRGAGEPRDDVYSGLRNPAASRERSDASLLRERGLSLSTMPSEWMDESLDGEPLHPSRLGASSGFSSSDMNPSLRGLGQDRVGQNEGESGFHFSPMAKGLASLNIVEPLATPTSRQTPPALTISSFSPSSIDPSLRGVTLPEDGYFRESRDLDRQKRKTRKRR